MTRKSKKKKKKKEKRADESSYIAEKMRKWGGNGTRLRALPRSLADGP